MKRNKLLLDADVLIDYLGTNFNVLKDVHQNIGGIYTTSDVLKEVNDLDF